MGNYQKQDFKCLNCGRQISTDSLIGTLNRNHCPFCLYSKHVDQDISGDRKSVCQGLMKPIGLTFKHEGVNKYGKEKQGEIMLIHRCLEDQKISINRIAGDDDPKIILEVFTNSQNLDLETKEELKKAGIDLLNKQHEPEILRQLYG